MRRCKLLSAGRTCISTASIFSAGARQIRLCDLKLRRLERFTYEYDFGDGWLHDIRLEAVLATDARKTYPTCIARGRAAPPKHCGGPDVFVGEGYHSIRFRTAFGDLALRSPRWIHCACNVRASPVSFSSLARLLSTHTAPELEYLQAK